MSNFLPPDYARFTADYAQLLRRTQTLEAQVAQLNSSLGAWTNYTCTWTAATTNPSPGSAIFVARYGRFGRMVTMSIYLSMASNTTYGSGAWAFTLPFTSHNPPVNFVGNWWAPNLSTAGTVFTSDGVHAFLFTDAGVAVDATHPGTWATNMTLNIQMTYESDT
jgi:hypothetical protein